MNLSRYVSTIGWREDVLGIPNKLKTKSTPGKLPWQAVANMWAKTEGHPDVKEPRQRNDSNESIPQGAVGREYRGLVCIQAAKAP
jgi:hypothetical protein